MTMNEFLINDTPVKIWAKVLDPIAYRQIYNLAALPFVFHHLAFMPDVHAGVGMPIGGVLATKGVVVPNAVGVDIGCGMCAVKTNVRVEDITAEVLRKGIMRGVRKRIPLGMDMHKTAQDESLMPQGFDIDSMTIVKNQYKSALKQIGTLGGGNHFIELQKDEYGWLWIMIHSGSRNLGKLVCDHYSGLAERLNAMWFSKTDPDNGLAFLPVKSDECGRYWNEMQYCMQFALANRKLMMDRICEVIKDGG